MAVALYRHYDLIGQLLYVGISLRPFVRLKEHNQTADWYRQVRFTITEWFDDRASALDAEALAIETERPLFNVARNTRREREIIRWAIQDREAREKREERKKRKAVREEWKAVRVARTRGELNHWHNGMPNQAALMRAGMSKAQAKAEFSAWLRAEEEKAAKNREKYMQHFAKS